MRHSEEDIQRMTEQLLARYTSQTFIFDEDPPFGLPEMIDAIADTILTDGAAIYAYSQRLYNTRHGIFPPGIQGKGYRFTEKEVGSLMGISGAAVSAKERYTASNPIKRINRNDLLRFCTIYDVSPHYLLGLVDNPSACIVHQESSRTFTPSCIEGETCPRECISPIWFEPVGITSRLRLAFVGLSNNPELRNLLIYAAERCDKNAQDTIQSWLKGWKGMDLSPIEDRKIADSNEDFRVIVRENMGIDLAAPSSAPDGNISIEQWMQDVWGNFCVSQFFDSDRYNTEADFWSVLGYQNFDFLDWIAKVALADQEAKALIMGVLKKDGFVKLTD